MNKVYLAFGSNLGDSRQIFQKAIEELAARGVFVSRLSSFYTSAPVPFVAGEPWYCNGVALVETDLPPMELMKVVLEVERQFGRVRNIKNAARTLDIDIIDYEGAVFNAAGITLPHPRLGDRAFVLHPLADIAPDWAHPDTRESIRHLIEQLPAGQRIKRLAPPQIMGIVNVTPDSFSDGGKYLSVVEAIRHAEQLISEGATIVDIGGESTRPGAAEVDVSEEIARVLPVIEGLKDCGAIRSVDTRHAEVMRVALDAGVEMINDVTALTGDEESLSVVVQSSAQVCLMHMKGTPQTMQVNPVYQDVVAEVLGYLRSRVLFCLDAGISADRITIDPGIGFGKTRAHNLDLLRNLGQFQKLGIELGVRVLIGASRKRFIADVVGQNIQADERLGGSLAAVAAGVNGGVDFVRVHDVAATKQFLDVYAAVTHYPNGFTFSEPTLGL